MHHALTIPGPVIVMIFIGILTKQAIMQITCQIQSILCD